MRKNAISTSFTLMCTFLESEQEPKLEQDLFLGLEHAPTFLATKFPFKLKVNAKENYF